MIKGRDKEGSVLQEVAAESIYARDARQVTSVGGDDRGLRAARRVIDVRSRVAGAKLDVSLWHSAPSLSGLCRIRMTSSLCCWVFEGLD